MRLNAMIVMSSGTWKNLPKDSPSRATFKSPRKYSKRPSQSCGRKIPDPSRSCASIPTNRGVNMSCCSKPSCPSVWGWAMSHHVQRELSITIEPPRTRRTLSLLDETLEEVGAKRLADSAVWPVRRALDVFGFHLAALDIRQNLKFHDQAIVQILTAVGQPAPDFGEWEESRRLGLSNRELQSPRPFLYHGSEIGDQADAVLGCYAVLRRHLREHGRDGDRRAHREHDASALRSSRRLFARPRSGTDALDFGGPACTLPVVPAFPETLDDLQRSAGLIEAFLSHPVTKRSLAALTRPIARRSSLFRKAGPSSK